MNPPNDKVVDHIDGNKANNRKNNLRICTLEQNSCNQKIHSNNTSGFPGVWYSESRNKWVAEIKINGKKIAKSFNDIENAIAKRIELEKQYFGEFRRASNFEGRI